MRRYAGAPGAQVGRRGLPGWTRRVSKRRTIEALSDDGAYDLERLRRRSVCGYRSLTPHLLRRAELS